jgi:hypothetical protein
MIFSTTIGVLLLSASSRAQWTTKTLGNSIFIPVLKIYPASYRCDPTRCTPDLGKWNISCNINHHQAICNWVDEHLVTVWQIIPLDLPEIATFPTPERLSKGRRAQGSSLLVASGLTDASPIADYMNTLESKFDAANVVSKTTRNPWIQSVSLEDVSYSFDAAAFPPFPTDKTSSTRTTTVETEFTGAAAEGATAISAITEGLLSSAISGIEQKRTAASADFDNHLKTLEARIAGINEIVIKMSTKTTNEVMRRLSAADGPLAQQNRVLLEQNNKMERMYLMLLALTGNAEGTTSVVTASATTAPCPSPAQSPRERDTSNEASTTLDACPSSDRQKLNQGLFA